MPDTPDLGSAFKYNTEIAPDIINIQTGGNVSYGVLLHCNEPQRWSFNLGYPHIDKTDRKILIHSADSLARELSDGGPQADFLRSAQTALEKRMAVKTRPVDKQTVAEVVAATIPLINAAPA